MKITIIFSNNCKTNFIAVDVILDTNIIRSDFLMNSHTFTTFLAYIKKTYSSIILPQIVKEELCKLYKDECEDRTRQLQRSVDGLNRIINYKVQNLRDSDLEAINQSVLQYEKYLRERLPTDCMKQIPYQPSYINEAVFRAINKIKPCSHKGEEFRDTLLWLGILDYLKNNKSDKIVFISANQKDFASADGRKLHETLAKELTDRDLQLEYFNSLKAFNDKYVAKIDFITSDWLNKNLNWDILSVGACKGAAEAHWTYFYEVFNRQAKIKGELDNYEVVDTVLEREVDMFFMTEFSNNNTYSISLFLGGTIEILFYTEPDPVTNQVAKEIIKVPFGTQTTIILKDGLISDYKDEYYEEETGLSFDVRLN